MNDNTHIIQKVVFELDLPKGLNHFAVQQRLEQLLEEKLQPKLNLLFDQLAGPGQWIELDNLEIDLGELSIEQENEHWQERLYTSFAEALESATSATSTQSKTRQQQQQDCLAYFLRQGYLPWWADSVDLEQLARQHILQQPGKLLTLLRDRRMRRRWVLQFDRRIQSDFSNSLGIRLPLKLRLWQSLFSSAWMETATALYWYAVWEVAQQSASDFDHEKWETSLIRNLFDDESGIFSAEIRQNTKVAAMLSAPAQKTLQDLLVKSADGSGPATSSHQDKSVEPEIESGGIYVPLAGTVLAHPFLPALFDKLGWLREDRFVDRAAQEKAVHLLYYIATQQQQPLEAELTLFKLLCGLKLDSPVPRMLNLSSTETGEAERMLQALIEHWPAVEGSSTEELRGTFFLREAKLVSNDLGWHLTVEQSGYDVLLARLPWGLSPIMHPWMERMIWVDWA